MDNVQHTTYNIKVPNNDLEILKQHFSHCFDTNGKFLIEKFQQSLEEKDINFSRESYSIEWLGKSYARLLASDTATTLLKEDTAHNQKAENANAQNLLLKGDNLEVLKHLSNAYFEKIKMIYIDPPYNTGNDGFVYNDDRKFTVSQLQHLAGIDGEKAKRIFDFTQSNSNSHSAWLTFMYPRLYIAKRLLKDDGVIFISIDDNEVAQLRLLMDEIFGEENFVAQLVWQKKTGASDAVGISIITEYILLYTKKSDDIANIFSKNNSSHDIKRYKYKDKFYEERGPYYIDNLDRGGLQYSDSLNFAIECPDGQLVFPNGRSNFKDDGWIWKWSKKKVEWAKENSFIEFRKSKNKDNGWSVCYKNYLNVDNENNPIVRAAPHKNLIQEILNTNASSNLKQLFNDLTIFSYAKPSELIKLLISYCLFSATDIILDFFAGSGTTGDAVMQLNAEDGGNRKYILVQLPETIDPKGSKAAYDFVKEELGVTEPTIFEITKERLLRAAKKIKAESTKKIVDFEAEIKKLQSELSIEETKEAIEDLEAKIKNIDTQDFGFKIFETMPIWEDYDFEADEIADNLVLFDETKLTAEDTHTMLTTWKTNDGIALTENLQVVDLQGYTAHYGKGKLYFMDKGFTTETLIVLIEKIDNDKDFNPTTINAWGYHFESKVLREISENLKSYTNKKKSDIDFITKY